jgi:type VI secretion system protein ImpJ
MGQALLPEHFYAQEQGIREEIALRARMTGWPAWGLASLRWDSFQLLKGIVSLEEMTLFLQSGAIVDIPGNTAPAFLNLNASGATSTTVYVHLQSAFDVVSFGQGAVGEEGIERVVQRVELSSEPYAETAAQSFKLAVFEAGPDGAWSLSPSFVPPLMRVGTSPFLESAVERAKGVARAVGQLLKDEIQDNYLAAESQASAKAALRGLYAFQGLLADLEAGVHLHPYELYRALRTLYVDVCVFRGLHPAECERPYDHEAIGVSFDAVLSALEEQVDVGRQRPPYVEFARKGGLWVCELSGEARRARDFYLLVQKPQVTTKLDMSRMKLASESRIHMVHERALRGIPLTKLDSPPFFRGISANVEFFSIAPGQEWDYAIREGSVVLFDGPQLDGLKLFVYWRSE